MYDALRDRIKVFEGSVGELQPILGEVERPCRGVYCRQHSEKTGKPHRCHGKYRYRYASCGCIAMLIPLQKERR